MFGLGLGCGVEHLGFRTYLLGLCVVCYGVWLQVQGFVGQGARST